MSLFFHITKNSIVFLYSEEIVCVYFKIKIWYKLTILSIKFLWNHFIKSCIDNKFFQYVNSRSKYNEEINNSQYN